MQIFLMMMHIRVMPFKQGKSHVQDHVSVTKSKSVCSGLSRVQTRGGGVLQEALHMDAPLQVLPNLKPSCSRVQQVGDDFLVDLQEAASARKPYLLPFPLSHTHLTVNAIACSRLQASNELHGSCICR